MSKPAQIVLLTDFGCPEFYTAMMKGVIKSIAPEAGIIDLFHGIEPQNIGQAAFLLVNSYRYFPEGTIFVTVVDPGVGSDRKGLIVKAAGRYFIGPDNGCFTFILEDNTDSEAFVIENTRINPGELSNTFHGRDVFAPAAALLASGCVVSEISQKTRLNTLVNFTGFKRIFKASGTMEGVVVMTDSFGNLVTNIHKKTFGKNNSKIPGPSVEIAGVIINGLKKAFADANKGDFLAYIGSMDYLEIAVNCGSAAEELGIGAGSKFSIRI